MKQVYFLKSFDEAYSVYLREAHRYENMIPFTHGIERYALKSIRNKISETAMGLQFSKLVSYAFGKKASITDIDCVLNVNGKLTAIIEMKRRNEDFRKYVMANARQFFVLRKFARALKVPLIYIYYIETRGVYRVLDIDVHEFVEVKDLGNGHSKDRYAVWGLQRSHTLELYEVPEFLRRLIY
jgi:hypothetical protein